MIVGKRVIRLGRHLSGLKDNQKFCIGVLNTEGNMVILKKYGMIEEKDLVQCPCPLGKVTSFNTEGNWVIDKTLPLIDREFEMAYHCVDWYGNDHYGTCYHTRRCYQRNFVEPPLEKITCSEEKIFSRTLTNSMTNEKIIKHVINMFLEMFGYCEIFNVELDTIGKVIQTRVNWTILPKGVYPWDIAKKDLAMIMSTISQKHRPVIEKRHNFIIGSKPDFMAIGNDGFWGYIVYGFTNKDIFVFESNKTDNATYVFRGNWENASKISKAEILSGKLQEARIIHAENWQNALQKIIR